MLLLVGYRPLVVHNQAVNLQQAVRRLQGMGVSSIEVWSHQPDTNFEPAALAALTDYYATVPVRFGGSLGQAQPEDKRHWWEFYQAPPWHLARHEPDPAPGALLCLYGAGRETFEQGPGADWQHVETVSRYRASSWLLPREVALYRGVPGLADEAKPGSDSATVP